MSFSIVNILLLLAAAQGFFLTAVIVRQAVHLYAARFLSVLLFLYSFLVALLLLHDLQISGLFLKIYLLFAGMPFVIGPLHYFYARFLINPGSKLHRKDFLHFLPAVVISCIFLPSQFSSASQLAVTINHADGSPLLPIEIIFNFCIALHAAFYSSLTLRMLKAHSRKLQNLFASRDKTQVNWLRILTWMAIACISIFTIENMLMVFAINFSNYFQLSSFIVAVYVYALGYSSITRADLTSDTANHIRNSETGKEKYVKSGLNETEAANLANKLQHILQMEKPYQDPGLTLNQLAQLSGISAHNISQILNTHLQQNFFDFINSYRLAEVKQALHNPQNNHLTILAIAFDAGFNSKSAFNTIFKKVEGCTPSEFRSRNQ